jgi:conjugative transfer region protein TrbK
MVQDLFFRKFPQIAATGFVVLTVAACAIQLDRHDEDQPPPPDTSEIKDSLAPKLEACLTVTPDQISTYEYCRRIWAENRSRFFGPQKLRSAQPPKKSIQQNNSAPPERTDPNPALQSPAIKAPAKE